jgi:hypothetical protein
MYNYIPHPSNASKASAAVTLQIEEGAAGYGVYWLVLELLRDCPDYRIGDNYKQIAWTIRERDADLVQRVCHNYGLFDVDDNGLLYSPWLMAQMEAYDAKKKKLQEAGRRGAAKRFGSPADGQALATPSEGDGQAKAIYHNVTSLNVTQHDVSQPSEDSCADWRDVCKMQGLKVDDELVEAISKTSPAGHAPGFIAQICRQYGMGQNVLDFLCERTNNAETSNSTYLAFCELVRQLEREKFTPKMPANFFLSKLISSAS